MPAAREKWHADLFNLTLPDSRAAGDNHGTRQELKQGQERGQSRGIAGDIHWNGASIRQVVNDTFIH